jgi:hypothetical protein
MDVDRNFSITGGIAISSKSDLRPLKDGKNTGTNVVRMLNVVHAKPIQNIRPRLRKLEGHSSQVAI